MSSWRESQLDTRPLQALRSRHTRGKKANVPWSRSRRTHSDTSLRLLQAGGGSSEEEQEILGSFEWSKNDAVLHWDERVGPHVELDPFPISPVMARW